VWLACVGLCIVMCACASTARITGDFGEYQSYRRTRLAPTLEARLGASDQYLRDYPHGDYRSQVRNWFLPAEQRYYRLSWDNLPRLRAYLDVMPKGPHAVDVADRISQLESRREFAARREQRMLEKARVFEAQLAQAAEQRHALLREISALTRLLAATRTFGKPMSALDAELLSRFNAAPLAGTCTADQCSKSFSFPFAVPEDKALSNRTLQVALEFQLERGQVSALSLSAPDLLVRVAEAVEVRAIPSDSPQARTEALAHALDVVADALDASLPRTSCEAPAISPVVLARRCQSVHLDVIAGTETGAPDRISIAAGSR
jgi:hypothetical protein